MTHEPDRPATTSDEFDDLIDKATHAVNNLIPDHVLHALSSEEHSNLLVQINDALTAILDQYIERHD